MATNSTEKTVEALPNLRKLLATNSGQEARSWVDDAQFHAQGFKDALKFFQPEYANFNPKIAPEKSKEWTRARPADPANNIEERAAGLHQMMSTDGRPKVETDAQFTERVKTFQTDRTTHDNLTYALTMKVPTHIARYIKDKANAAKLINVQDICKYIIDTYDITTGVSTQDTWSEQYTKLKNKDRKKPAEFSKFLEEQQRLANIYISLSATYSPDVQVYRDGELRNLTMQLYRSNLPHHNTTSDHPDRFIDLRQKINTTSGKLSFASYDELSKAINAAYLVWVNDDENQNVEKDEGGTSSKKEKPKRKRRDEEDEGRHQKKNSKSCRLHPNGKHPESECRDLKILDEAKAKNIKGKEPADKKTSFKKKEEKKTRFDANASTIIGCSNCKIAKRPFRSHETVNCFYGKKCTECKISGNHLVTCSMAKTEKEDLESIFANGEVSSSNTTSSQPAKEEDLNEFYDDLFGVTRDVNGILQDKPQLLEPPKEKDQQVQPAQADDELMDWSLDELDINKNVSNYPNSLKIISKMKNQTFDENIGIKENFPFITRKINFEANTVKTLTPSKLESFPYKEIGIIDTGCENHMTPDKNLIIPETYEDLSHTGSKVIAAEGSETKIIGQGTMKIRLENGREILFPKTLIVPNLRQTLISPQQILERYHCTATFNLHTFELKGKTSIMIGYYKNRNWVVRNYKQVKTMNTSITKIPLSQTQYEHIHVTLGHPGERILNKILTKGLLITGYEEYDKYVAMMDKGLTHESDNSLCVNTSFVKLRRCLICDSSKAKKYPFSPSEHKVTSVNEKIGTDLTGPIRTEGFRSERYIMILIDYYTKYLELHCLVSKDTWPDTLITALKRRVTKHDAKIKSIRTDNAEMQSNKSIAWLNDEGIIAEYIPPGGYHSEMGGGYERYFLTISTMITATLLQANLPPKFWSLSATHNSKVKNMWYNYDLDTSPYIAEEKKKPNISQYHPFGCFVIYRNDNDNKILPDGDPGLYVGNKATNIYLIYNLKTKKLDQSAHVRFYDHFFPGIKTTNITDLDKLMKNNTSNLSEDDKLDILKLFEHEYTKQVAIEDDQPIITKESLRQKGKVIKGKEVMKGTHTEEKEKLDFEDEDDFDIILPPFLDDSTSEVEFSSMNNIKNIFHTSYIFPKPEIPLLNQSIPIAKMAPLPMNMREALKRPDAERWQMANDKEKDAFINKWKVGRPIGPSELLPGDHVIPTKLVFAYKDHEGLLKDYKVRIVGRGDLMRKDEYEDTFSPVVRIKTQRILIALAVANNLVVKQFDCDNAYLQGKTRRRILIRLPENWILKTPNGEETRIAIAEKALYGLKESGRDWYITLRDDLLNDKYSQLEADPCVFIKLLNEKELNIISIYVDDGLQICKEEKLMDDEFQRFRTRFKASDYRFSDYILSITTEHFSEGIVLHQAAYAKMILDEIGMWEEPINGKMNGTKPTPMSITYKYDESFERLDKPKNSLYRSIVMKLSYLAQQTRADILYAVNVLAQYQEKPTINEWKALVHILRYIKGTWDYGPFYRKTNTKDQLMIMTNEDVFPSSKDPECFADASFANEDKRKSRSGYLYFMSGAIVTWCSKKQPVISVSSTEAELYSLSEAVREGVWIRKLLKELQQPLTNPTIVNQDNKSTIAIAKNPIHHQRTKHIDVKMNQLRQYLDNKDLVLKWCPTEDMIADILTKPLPAAQHQRFTKLMGYVSVSDLRKRST